MDPLLKRRWMAFLRMAPEVVLWPQHALTCTCKCTHMHLYTYPHTPVHIPTCTCTHSHAPAHELTTPAQTPTGICIHTYTYACTKSRFQSLNHYGSIKAENFTCEMKLCHSQHTVLLNLSQAVSGGIHKHFMVKWHSQFKEIIYCAWDPGCSEVT